MKMGKTMRFEHLNKLHTLIVMSLALWFGLTHFWRNCTFRVVLRRNRKTQREMS
jgi:hypothetical protein